MRNNKCWAVFYRDEFINHEKQSLDIEKKDVVSIAREFAKVYKVVSIARKDSRTGRYSIVASILNHQLECGKIFD